MYDGEVINEIYAELKRAREVWPDFHSEHEGYAVILKEVRELEREVFTRPSGRNVGNMIREATQVGAMAARFIADLTKG